MNPFYHPLVNGDDAAIRQPGSESGEPETSPKNGKPVNRILPFSESTALSSATD